MYTDLLSGDKKNTNKKNNLMKTNHRFLPVIPGSHVRIIGTRAIGVVELLDVIKTSDGAELFAKIRYKNRLTRFSRVSDLGVILPKFLKWLYPAFDGKKSFKQCLRHESLRQIRLLEKFFSRFISSDLDRVLIGICIALIATLAVVFLIR